MKTKAPSRRPGREPSDVPYPTDPRVSAGREHVTQISGLVFVSAEHEDHLIHLILDNGYHLTVRLRERRPKVRKPRA